MIAFVPEDPAEQRILAFRPITEYVGVAEQIVETVSIEEAESRLEELARRVEQGVRVVVTRDGEPVLDLVRHKRNGGFDREGLTAFKRSRGIDKIVLLIAPDFDEPLPDDFLNTAEADLKSAPTALRLSCCWTPMYF